MDFPLQPKFDSKDSDVILERFLEYLEVKGIDPYPAQEEAILEVYGLSLIHI